MKKTFKILVMIMLLFSCVACKEEPPETESSFVLPLDKLRAETTTAWQEYVWVEPTRADDVTQGLIPNSVGIVVQKSTRFIEQEHVDIPDEERGLEIALNTSNDASEDAARLGVSKVLTFYGAGYEFQNVNASVISEFNNLLVNKYGCDFVVSFCGGSAYMHDNYGYYDAVKDMRNMGKQADVLVTGYRAYYERLVDEGFFVDITDELTSTTYGKKLYDAYPDEVWDMVEIDGRIYGYTVADAPANTCVVSCNKAMADKYGLEVKEGFSFYDIGDILEKANLSAESLGEVIPIYIGWSYLYEMLGYYNMDNGILAKKDASGQWVAFNPLEDKEFIKLCKKIKEYKDKGWIEVAYDTHKKLKDGEFIFAVTGCKGADIADNKILYAYRENKVVLDAICGETVNQYYDLNGKCTYGITTWSEYKEEAFKLISLINTEAELARLLIHGVEDTHYIYNDNKVTKLPIYDAHRMDAEAISLNLSLPEYLEPADKTAFYKEIAGEYEPSPFAEYDLSRYEYVKLEETYDFNKIFYQIYHNGFYFLLSGEYDDVDAAISEIKRMQKEAGIDEFIVAINKMFKNAWIREHVVDE